MPAKTKAPTKAPKAPPKNVDGSTLTANELDTLETLGRAMRSLRDDVGEGLSLIEKLEKKVGEVDDKLAEAEIAAKKGSDLAQSVRDRLSDLRRDCAACRNEPERGIGRCVSCNVMIELINEAREL